MAELEGTQVEGQGEGQGSSERRRLQTLLKTIIPYLPYPVVEGQLADLEVGRVKGDYWEGSVLFADLSGFTALSETLSKLGKQGSEEITRIVNDLFEALLEDVERYGGVLVKFGGDALTVYFGGDGHALRAVRAGLALQETMDRRFVNLSTPGGVFTLRLRVGVHTGKIFAAQVGYEPGYPLRGMELVVTGADINRVADAQDYAAPGQICITAETLSQIAAQASAEPVASGTYRLVALSPSHPIESSPTPPVRMPLDEWPLPRLRLCLQALRPYLPVDFGDERIADPSDPQLRPDLRPVAVLFAHFADLSAILAMVGDKGEAGVRVATRILNMYYARMQEVIGRYGGVVNKVDMYTHGDKLMAIFGAPLAHEDDAERAVRAALEMQAAMPGINRYVEQVLREVAAPFASLTQRIGINFGHVFAGNVGSERESSRREYTVMGDTVNLAARLMAAAEIGDILISPAVRRRVSDKFKLDDLPPIQVKGKAEPISVSRPLRQLTERERLALRRGRRPFIGRADQLETMQDAATDAIGGHGQVVVIIGEAGTGKTRLVEAFQDALLKASPAMGLNCYVTELPSYAQEPYAPIIDLLRRLIGLGGETFGDVERLKVWVQERVPELRRFLPLLGALLALPIPDNRVTSALTPEQRHDRLFDLIEGALHGEAQRHPLALVVDDLQWGDDSSLILLERLTETVTAAPLLLVLCYRPNVLFSTPWTERSHTRAVQVTEFTPQESARLVAELLETEELPEGLAEMVWARAHGNPFFTEEFVKALRETNAVVRRDGRWQLVVDEAAATTIPDTIEGIVLARLDRLGARYRDVLQEASVAAASQPRFVQSLLEQVDPYPVELPERLRRLVSDGLLEALESELEALEYHFRHALTRDVAYDSLLYARRRELHRFIAQAIELVYADRLDEHVISLAHHYLEAEEWPQAFVYHHRAGERAQVLFANKNAIAYFHTALTIAEERMPDLFNAFDALELLEALIHIREHLGDVLQLEGRYDEALEAYEAGRTLLTKEEAPVDLTRFYRKIAVIHEHKGDYPLALEWLERGLDALGDQDHVEKARIYNWGGGVYYRQGDREQALEWRQRALQIAQRLGDQREIADAYLIMAMIYSDWGATDRALDYGRHCLDAFEAAGDLAGSVKARLNVGLVSYRADDWAQALEHYREGLRLSEMMNDGLRIGQFSSNMGNVYLSQGNLDKAAAAYRHSIAVLQPRGYLGGVVVLRINLGKVAVTQGDLQAGEAYLSDALALSKEIGARGFLPEIYRWQALLQLAHRRNEEALALSRQALGLAQELKDRAEEGGALRTLGRVYRAMAQPEKALQYLRASLLRFIELKSTYEAAKTCFHLALVFLDRSDQREEGRGLLTQVRPLFAELGAQWDLARVDRVLDELSRSSTGSVRE